MPPLVTEDGTQLDSKVLKVVRAIRQVESQGDYNAVGDGGNSHGAYQWNKDNFRNAAKEILGDANAPMTPANQNKVAYYQVKAYKDAGRDPEEIAALWNGASKDQATGRYVYNAPEYGVKFRAALALPDNQLGGPQQPQISTADQLAQEQSGATFGARTGEGALAAGLKTAGNIPSSGVGFLKGLVDAVNPISTIGRLFEIPKVIGEIAGQKQSLPQLAGNLGQGVYDALIPQAPREAISGLGGAITGNRIGNTEDFSAAQRDLTNDPVGSILPLLLAGRGAAGVADSVASRSTMRNYVDNIGENVKNRVPIPGPSTRYTSAFDNGISRTANLAKPLTAPVRAVGSLIGKTADFGIKQATGLSGETRSTITQNPEAFTKANRESLDRASLSETIRTGLESRIDALDESKAAYQPIRNSGTQVKVDPDFIDKSLSDVAKVSINKGKIKPTATSKVREARDIAALQAVYDFWKPAFKRGFLTAEEFLNFRSDLAKAAKYGRDVGKSAPVEDVASVVRGRLNTAYRNQIKGLEDLDAQTSSQIKEFGELKKGLLDKNNELTDAAINRIANATNKGRDAVLARLEEISPGITRKIQIVKAIEDIEKASENKVGTYARAALGVGSLLTVNIPGLIATILAQPEVAVPILRQYGFAKPIVQPVLKALKASATTVNNSPQRLPPILPVAQESVSP